MKNYNKIKSEILKDPKFKKVYDDLEPEFELARQIIKKRLELGWSQSELARKMGTKQSAIARLESGGYNPSMAFLQKTVKALKADLQIIIS
ncbi:MAG: helix-turn-helix transcriptional regulator [Candidatus Magasanikiibacteriota bacterium]